MGTPEFAGAILNQIVATGHNVVAVYSQPPRPAGRGKNTKPSATHSIAESLNIDVHCPQTFQEQAEINIFKALKPDVAIVAAYGVILPQSILDIPKYGCLNIHASLLPRWRGAAPVQRAIIAGDTSTGICIMQMEAGLDTGPVLLRREIDISATDTGASLSARLSAVGGLLVLDALTQMEKLTSAAQPQSGVTYAKKIDKRETRIDWSRPAQEVDRQIRALSPFPGAWCETPAGRLKILLSHPADGAGTPGKILDNRLTIACGDGAVQLLQVQKPGKTPAAFDAYLRGHTVKIGDIWA